MEAATIWLKVIHMAALLFWCAGLVLLPALLAAHAQAMPRDAFYRLRARIRMAYLGIVTPSAIIAVVSGSVLIPFTGAHGGWLALKLTAVALMVAFHVVCGALLRSLRDQGRARSAGPYLSMIVFPAILISLVLWLVLDKPL
jgi:protoporphyrinogen IX oxidase